MRKVSPGHILSAVFGMLLAALGALGILVRLPVGVLGVGIDSILIFCVYLLGVRMLGRYDEREPDEQFRMAVDPPPVWVRHGASGLRAMRCRSARSISASPQPRRPRFWPASA